MARIITIARGIGSGGRTVGKAVRGYGYKIL